jgi:hypothetical protein
LCGKKAGVSFGMWFRHEEVFTKLHTNCLPRAVT